MPTVTLHKEKRPTKRAPNLEKWVLRWFDSTGGRRGEIIGVVGKMGRREAEAVRRAKQGGMDHGVVLIDRPKAMTLGELVKRDREAIQCNVRPTTLLEYDMATWYARDAIGGDTKVAAIGREHVGRLKNYLKQPGRTPAGNDRKPLSDASVRKIVKTLSSVLKHALEDGLIAKNPFAGAAKGKTQSKKKRLFSPEEICALIDGTPNQWWAVFIDVLANSGIRKGEALNLHWTDIDFQEGTLTVTRKQAGSFSIRGEAFPILDWETKSHEERTIPLPTATLQRLQRFRLTSGGSRYVFLTLDRLRAIQRRLDAGTWKPKSELVNNLRARFGTIQRRARRLMAERQGVTLAEVEWERGCFHDLRRTWGTYMAQFVECFQLCEWIGHADPKTTRDHYYCGGSEAYERARRGFEALYG